MAGNNRRHGKVFTPKTGKRVDYAPRARKSSRPMPREGDAKAVGKIVARSVKPNGGIYVTLHHTRAKAEKRLAGNRRHIEHSIRGEEA